MGTSNYEIKLLLFYVLARWERLSV